MFVSAKIIRKLMKEAWKKAKLQVARDEKGNWIMQTMSWRIEMKSPLDKRLVAQLIELCEEIPEKGMSFLAGPEGNQYEFVMDNLFYEEQRRRMRTTGIMLDNGASRFRVLQDRVDLSTVIVDDKLVGMISDEDLLSNEPKPGDAMIGRGGKTVLWDNGEMKLYSWVSGTERYKDVLQALSSFPDIP